MVLGGRPDHRWAADVDLLDELVEADPGPLGGSGERIEVDDDQLERGDGRRDELAAMVRETTVRQDAGVDPRVKGLDSSVEHLRKAGNRRDVGDRQAGVPERAGGATGRDKLKAETDQAPPEVGQAGLVRNRQERSPRSRDARLRPIDIEDDPAPAGLDRQGAREQQCCRPREDPMLDGKNPLMKRGKNS